MAYRDLPPEDVHGELGTDPELRILDVRMPHEFVMHRVDGAILIPIQELAERVDELDQDAHYVIVCQHGIRSTAACEFLSQQGFSRLTNVSGGMAAWVTSGLPFAAG